MASEEQQPEIEAKPAAEETTSTGRRPARNVKKVERLAPEVVEKEAFEIKEGKGKKLGSIENVCFRLDQKKGGDEILKAIHSICFGRPGKKTEVKRNIKEFSGFVYENREEERAKIQDRLAKLKNDQLKEFLSILDLERSGDKDALVERIADFLENPHGTSNKSLKDKHEADKAKKERKRKRNEKEKSAKPKKAASKPKAAKSGDKSSSESEPEPEPSAESSAEASDESEYSTKAKKPAKKKAKTNKGAAKAKKDDDKSEEKEEKETKKKAESAAAEPEPMDVTPTSGPSNAEISAQIREYLKVAAEDDKTQKKVRKALEEHFKCSLEDRKEKIKELVQDEFEKM